MIKTAQANLIQAKADYKQQMVKQQELLNALQEAINTYKQDSLQREMQLNEQEMNELIYNAQTEAAYAQAAYEKAMVEIEIALMGYKDNAIAEELMKVISYNQYLVEIPVYNPTSGTTTTQTRPFYGLTGINAEIRTAESNLAQYMRELSKLQFTYDISTKIAAVEGQLAVEKGTLQGLQKQLEKYKVIAGKPYEEWDAQYQELLADSIDVNNQLTAIDIEEQEALKPVLEQEKTHSDAKTAKSEIAFVIPEAIQNDFAQVLAWASVSDFNQWAVVDADGKTTYPSGVKASMTMDEKQNALAGIMNVMEGYYVLTDDEFTQLTNQVNQLKATYDAYWAETTGIYNVNVNAWKNALKAYQDLYVGGKYFDLELNDRALRIKEYNNLASLTGTELTAAETTFRTNLKTYLSNRQKLDGFMIGKTADLNTAIDPTNDTDWAQWKSVYTSAGEDAAFGPNFANGATIGLGALEDYRDAAVKMGYDYNLNPAYARQLEFTYAEYEEYGYGYPSDVDPRQTTVGLAFEARRSYELANTVVTNKADWDKLYADLTALDDANNAAIEALDVAEAETVAERAKIEAEYDAKKTALEVEKEGLLEVMSKIQSVLTNAGATGADYDLILADLKQKIAELENGGAVSTGTDFVFVPSTGQQSIPAQEVVVASYEKLLAALNDGTYKPLEETAISQKQAQIDAQTAYIEALNAIFKAVSDKKDALLAALAAE